ncbi:aconitase family protein [Pseudomonas sp. Z1-14]|uniref:aconitase family protein n=1 Tax=Pseudomonas sp. Z1-14 TaxID=2817409 RepID=UPI003DA7CDDD
MINAIGVLGWGVAAWRVRQRCSVSRCRFSFPDVIGTRLSNELRPGVTATDLALRITHMLRTKGVVRKFV